MNSAWMLSCALVSMLIGTAALCVERVLMLRRGTPVRWVWLAAIAVSIAWSARWLLPAPALVETPQAASSLSSELPDLVVTPSAVSEATQSTPEGASTIDWTATLAIMPVAPLAESAESRVRLVWLCMSAALLVVLVWSHVRLARERRQWRATSLLGSDVLVSNGFGPAIVGMRRPCIVVPPWVLDVDASAQRTILLHEDEHRRARDQWLLIASFGAVALAPWNVVLWLMRRRLARAIELDCDERVLAHGVADVDYANVLLNAWQLARGAMPWAPTPALTEHVSRLGRRVEHLMRPAPQGILMKSIGGAFMSAVLMGAAMFVPAPQQAQSRPAPPPPTEQVPSVPPPSAQIPSVPAPQREKVLSVPAPLPAHASPIPTPKRVPSPPAPVPTPSRGSSLPAPAPNPPLPAIEKAQVPPVPPPAPTTAGGTTQRAARLLVIMPWDSTAASLAKAVHERLAEDLRGKMVYVIPHAEFVQYASASGFSSNTFLTPSDVKALRTLVRADLVVAIFELRPVDGGFRVYASTVGVGDAAPLRILEGEGSVTGISNSLIRALHADPAYKRLLSESGATSPAPTRYFRDSTGRVVGFQSRSTANNWTARFHFDPAFRAYRSKGGITWLSGFIVDTANYKFGFRFLPSANTWFTRFGFDSAGHVIRFRPPPLG